MSAASAQTLRVAAPPAATTMSDRQKAFGFAAMCVGMFIALLDIQIVSASLRDIGGGLSAGTDETVWVQTSYLIAEIIVIPLSGWLARVMSTRWLFCASAVGFTIASLLCGIAWNIQSMIAFRAIQGFLGGSMIPLVFTSAVTFFGQGPRRVIATATVGAIASLAPTLGPTVGGWITDHFSWQWLFLINVAPGAFVAVAVPLLVRGLDRPNRSLIRGADYPGIVLLALFLGCLEYALEEGPRLDWFGDVTILGTAWISGIAGIAFVWRTLSYPQPIVDLRALKLRNFALGCFFSFVTGIGLFATIYLTPLFLGNVRGYSASQIGIAVCSTGVGQMLSIPLYVFLAKRFDLRWLMMLGMFLFAFSMWNFMPITSDWGAEQLLVPQLLRGMAQSFAVGPAVNLTLGALAPARLQYASGLFNLMRNLGGAIGIAVCATILNDRTNLHFLRLTEHLTSNNQAMNDWLQRAGALAALQRGAAEAHAGPLKELWARAIHEAQTESFADVYVVIMVCFAIATMMVPLLKKVAVPKVLPSAAH